MHIFVIDELRINRTIRHILFGQHNKLGLVDICTALGPTILKFTFLFKLYENGPYTNPQS